MTAKPFSLSNAPVGSSARMAEGSPTIARDHDALLLTAAQLVRERILLMRQTHDQQRRFSRAIALPPRSPRTSKANRTLSIAVSVGNSR